MDSSIVVSVTAFFGLRCVPKLASGHDTVVATPECILSVTGMMSNTRQIGLPIAVVIDQMRM
jgi:hypothetical protein